MEIIAQIFVKYFIFYFHSYFNLCYLEDFTSFTILIVFEFFHLLYRYPMNLKINKKENHFDEVHYNYFFITKCSYSPYSEVRIAFNHIIKHFGRQGGFIRVIKDHFCCSEVFIFFCLY